jgi:tyrosine-protein kinase Etk/Wzc
LIEQEMQDVMSTATRGQAALTENSEYRTVDLRRHVAALWKRRYFVIGCAIGGGLLAYGAGWLMHPQYDATVRMMPPTPKTAGLSLLMPTRNPGDQYLGLISSRTVADDVIAHQHLADYFHTTKPSELRRRLEGMAKITVDKSQFVTVRVRAREPETALRVANEFPAALYRLNDAITLAEAEHQLRYFEGPLEEEQARLSQAAEALRDAQQKTGMPEPEVQVRLGIGAIADLRQQLASRQEQLAGLEAGRTSENPQVVTLKSQIASLEAQIHQLQAQTGGGGNPAATAKLPELAMEVAAREREVKYHEALFEILSKQYEGAKVDEAYSPPVELVDRAVLPDEKSWPPKRWFAIGGFLLGGLFGFLIVFLKTADVRRRLQAVLTDDGS